MSRLLVFQHVAAEPLGTLDPLIRRRGHRVRYVNFERHPEHEPNVDRYRGLIVLGGPMNVEEHERRAHLRAEMRAIERMLHQGKPVLGICLGAQLLAHVLGAPVRRNEVPEIGWHRLRTTPQGREDPVLAPLGEQAEVFQWHAYRFDIPHGAVHLAETDTCAQQAFRYGDNAYGFQFHLEMDQHLIERWLAHPLYREELLALAGCGQARSDQPRSDQDAAFQADPAAALLAQTRVHIGAMQSHADDVFNRFLDRVGRPQRRFTLPSREFG